MMDAMSSRSDKRILYISWAESCSRSDHTARELGGASEMVYLKQLGSHPLTIVPKYVGQTLRTLWLLARQRPDAVIVMSPPIVASFAAVLYRYVTGRPYGLDCHTAAFDHPRWKRLQWLQHAIGRRAAVNIVHNEHLQSVVTENQCPSVVVKDVPVVYASGEPYDLSAKFNVTVVCSFNPDEPIDAILEAASRQSDVQYYLTGNPKYLRPNLREALPPNVQLTGFISDTAFGDLLCRSDVVMSLTTRDHTMLRGAWEAIYQGTPVIVSDWPILQEAFSQGAVHVDNSAEQIVEAVRYCQQHQRQLRQGAQDARQARLQRWRATREQLFAALFPE